MRYRKRIVLITEYFIEPYDEGIKKTAYNLCNELRKYYDVHVIARYGFEGKHVNVVDTNSIFLSFNVYNKIRFIQPDVLLYMPFSASTFASYIRFKVLGLYANHAKKLFIALQPKQLRSWQGIFLNFLKPEVGLTPSPDLYEFWQRKKINSRLLPLLTEVNKFKPLQNLTQKLSLRTKYNIPAKSFIISHMGHLNDGRNLYSLLPLQKAGYQVVLIVSSSTPKDAIGPSNIRDELLRNGFIIIDQYLPRIEEIYQLSDLYIFPVVKKNSSIGLPLSILEARACGIPVLTTEFGSVKHFLGSDNNSIYYSTPENFAERVGVIKNLKIESYNNTKVCELNERFFDIISKEIGTN